MFASRRRHRRELIGRGGTNASGAQTRPLVGSAPIGDDRPMRLPGLAVALIAAGAMLVALPVAGRAADRATVADLQRGLDGLVAARGGPPGAIATLYRNG